MGKFTKTTDIFVIKNKTNGGDLCKTRYVVTGNSKEDVALLIFRLTLSRSESYSRHSLPLKTFKGKTLWYQQIGIKLTTLRTVLEWLNTLDIENEFK